MIGKTTNGLGHLFIYRDINFPFFLQARTHAINTFHSQLLSSTLFWFKKKNFSEVDEKTKTKHPFIIKESSSTIYQTVLLLSVHRVK